MTVIRNDKPLIRKTDAYYRKRELIVNLKPRHMEIREKFRRDIVTIDYATIYEAALKLRWRREQAEKRAAKKKS